MGQVVYTFSGSTFSFLESPFGQVLGEEIYAGDVGARSSGEMGDVTLERGTRLPIPILALKAKITTTMRRTRRHVREGAKQFYVVWLVEKGQVSISCSNGTKVIPSNRVMITNSTEPFYIEAQIGHDGEHRNKLALVPAHLLDAHMPAHEQLNTMSFSAQSVDGKVVTDLLNLLFDQGDDLDHDDATTMLRLALRALGRMVGEQSPDPEKRSMQAVRLAQIKAQIDLHLANQGLTQAEVARLCGISPRYLSRIMEASGMSFATCLRERRLEEARTWLSAPEKRDYPIGEIAAAVGFKSAAQLSRSFQAQFGCVPRAYRKQSLTNGSAE